MKGDKSQPIVGERTARDASAALSALMEQPVPPLPRAQAKALEQQVVHRIEAMAAEARNRKARRAVLVRAVVAAAFAAVFAATLTVVLVHRTPARATVAQVALIKGSIESTSEAKRWSSPVPDLVPIADDEEIRTSDDGVARASLVTGAVVEIGPATSVSFASRGSRPKDFDTVVVLDRGRVSLDVPPQPAGVALSVRTPDATITVHGTRFAVERTSSAAGGPDETRVSVTEGRVAVHAGAVERFLVRGQLWSSRDAENVVDGGSSPPAPPPTVAQENREAPAGSGSASARERPRDPPRTTLTVENELLESAMEARRRGQPKLALERLDRLLKQYPTTPLAGIARGERRAALAMLAKDAGGGGW